MFGEIGGTDVMDFFVQVCSHLGHGHRLRVHHGVSTEAVPALLPAGARPGGAPHLLHAQAAMPFPGW